MSRTELSAKSKKSERNLVESKPKTLRSPLRYPGGKYRFRELVSTTVDQLNPQPRAVIEPFCGGAGISVALLTNRNVSSVALNDADPMVAAFWKVVFGKAPKKKEDFHWLIDKIEHAPITLKEWVDLKESSPRSIRDLAWKCLFLNRTSFNGILHKAGPIGGWGQELRKLDVRFNRESLVKSLKELWSHKEQVSDVSCEHWKVFCDRHASDERAFIYLDPPYYYKAEQLYGHLFNEDQHIELRDYLERCKVPWILSYDDSLEVRKLYSDIPNLQGIVIDKTYSTHPIGGASYIGRELFLSNCHIGENHASSNGYNVVGAMRNVDNPKAGIPVRQAVSTQGINCD
jgi:DNA adenine methylase